MSKKFIPWVLAIALVGFFSWPSEISAHGDEDHGRQTGGCANVP